MWKTTEGSSGRLIQLCIGYFVFYVITGVSAKLFTATDIAASFRQNQIEYMIYNTIGGMLTALLVVFVMRWYRLKSNKFIKLGNLTLPQEVYYIIPSGLMTAIIIPTTTLLYTFQLSVMVAMVIMRASVIVIGRVVDAIQIKQGILNKKVYMQENIAVIFAILAASVNIFWVDKGGFDFLQSTAAVVILTSYIVAYAIRIYIMNYFKNTRAKGVPLDNQGYFGIEQITAFLFAIILGIFFYNSPTWFGWNFPQLTQFHSSIIAPNPMWGWTLFSGTAFGVVAFFSVFLFMFKGRTATFTGLVNRLTSLAAGTVATLISAVLLGAKFPKMQDWISLTFILIAVGFLSVAERKRTKELVAANEIPMIKKKN